MEELELKFEVPKASVASLRAALLEHGARPLTLHARYYDSADDVLAAHGMALRLRREGPRWVQTLKAAGASAVSRFEHGVTLDVDRDAEPDVDPTRHAAAAPSALQDVLARLRDGTPLLERYRCDVVRLACDLHLPDAVVEMALDLGEIGAGARTLAVSELELELEEGRREALFELGAAWAGVGGLWLDVRSKSERGLRLARGEAGGPPVYAAAVGLDRHMGGGTLLRAVLLSALEQVLGNASEAAAGSGGEEHVHQLRIGLRRLRTALRELGALSARIDARWDGVLAEAARSLGALRDQQALANAVEPLLQGAGAPTTRWAMPAQEADAGAAVRQPALQRVLVEILGLACSDAAADAPVPAGEARSLVEQRLQRLHRRLRRAAKDFEALPREQQHRARKRLKRLRYLAEFVAPLWPHHHAERYLSRLERAQDALGRHNDIAVAADHFGRDGQADPRSLFAAGWLGAHLQWTAHECRRELGRVTDTVRFWRG